MPGFNGTGPMGEGPMTGGARGYCAGNTPKTTQFAGGFGAGRGMRRGCGRGMRGGRGSGFGFGMRYGNTSLSSNYPNSNAPEADNITGEINSLRNELSEIKTTLTSILNKDKE